MQRHLVFIATGFVLAASWLSVALLNLDPPGGDVVRVGYFLGSLFAHATLAAAWCVFGPGRRIFRVPLSLAWAGSLPVAIAVNIAVNGGPDSFVFPLGVCLVGQWLLLQLPFAGVALGFGVQLRHTAEMETGVERQRIQFGIRDLLIVTAICSVILGLGRVIVPTALTRGGRDLPIFVFLAIAAVVMTVPLLLAALLQRKSLIGVLLSLLLIALATVSELPLLQRFPALAGPTSGHIIAINIASAVLVLVIAGIVRLHGYGLFARRASTEP